MKPTSYELSSVGKKTDRGYNCTTVSGTPYYPLKPYAGDVDICDIGHALTLICRFGGHIKEFYSVGQHSIWVSKRVPKEHRLKALLHDAPEYVIGDMVRPLKYQDDFYREVEARNWQVICQRFGMTPDMPEEIKIADNLALWTEKRDLIHNSDLVDWGPPGQTDPEIIVPKPMREVYAEFMYLFVEYGGQTITDLPSYENSGYDWI